jgi:hypothetical protein
VVHVQDGEATVYCAVKEVNAIVVHWEDLERGSRGLLCDLYKELWATTPYVRKHILPIVIAAIKRRFPIKARFHPQRFRTADKIEPDGPPVEFDVTEVLLNQGPDYIDNLRDVHYPTDELADDLPERQAHDGPFAVEIKEAAMEFLFAAENEAEAEKLAKAEREAAEAAKKHAAGWGMSPERLAEVEAATAARLERAARGAATRKKNREAKKKKKEEETTDAVDEGGAGDAGGGPAGPHPD